MECFIKNANKNKTKAINKKQNKEIVYIVCRKLKNKE